MSLVSAVIVTVLGVLCGAGTIWWALRAERTYGAASAVSDERPPPEQQPRPGWWESADWWPALSQDEQQWVLQNLADAGHPAADAALRPGAAVRPQAGPQPEPPTNRA